MKVFIVLLSAVMYASAGHLAAVPAVYPGFAYQAPAYAAVHTAAPVAIHAPAYGTATQHLVRSYDGTISQYAKAIDTPFSSVRKHDTRITNSLYPGYGYPYAAAAYHAPAAYHHAPAYAAAAYHAPAYAAAAHPVAAVSHVSFDGLGAHYGW